jgi:hypothetical protein
MASISNDDNMNLDLLIIPALVLEINVEAAGKIASSALKQSSFLLSDYCNFYINPVQADMVIAAASVRPGYSPET